MLTTIIGATIDTLTSSDPSSGPHEISIIEDPFKLFYRGGEWASFLEKKFAGQEVDFVKLKEVWEELKILASESSNE